MGVFEENRQECHIPLSTIAPRTIQLPILAVFVITTQAVSATVHQMNASATCNTTFSVKFNRVTTAAPQVESISMQMRSRTNMLITVMQVMITASTIRICLKSKFCFQAY
ncbi:MAG: hypothetical protein EBR26_02575 [Microbacteriaceae bacterium]|nr:hypothetical protein [Microbacteriaceae bacterium]